uniref:Uncharacterized protein n=1 Tax=Aegilops tauschii subsp. strangulata TaxID=200361 RepID=A0A453MG25_AEGTS
ADATLISRLSEGPDETWTAVDLGQPVLKDTVFPIYYDKKKLEVGLLQQALSPKAPDLHNRSVVH